MSNVCIIVDDDKKRTDYIKWDEYFMGVAQLSSKRSKDPSRQVGACIVDTKTNIITSVGYNGFPIGISDDDLPWGKSAADANYTKYPYVCHAEMNAIVNNNSRDLRGTAMYVTLFPCVNCIKLAIQSGIKEIIYKDTYDNADTSMYYAQLTMCELAGVSIKKYNTSQRTINLEV